MDDLLPLKRRISQPVKLTDLYVRGLRPPATGRLAIPDKDVPGLAIRVTATGVKSWQIRYRPKGKPQRYEIPGRFDPHSTQGLSLAAARLRARDIIAAARRGIDLPAEERRQAEDQANAEAAASGVRTVRDLAEAYVNKHCKLHQRRWRDTELRLRNHVLPKLGDRIAATIRRGDIIELLDHIEQVKGMRQQVNRTRTTLGAMFDFAIEREYEYAVRENPVAGTRRRKVEGERSRVLNDDELKAIWLALQKLQDPGRSFVQLLMLTGTRRDEARGLQWHELDLEQSQWLLPGTRNKSGKEFEVPLPRQAVRLLELVHQVGPYVFTANARGEKPWSAHGPFKAELDERSGVRGWVFHDIRRTVRSRLAELRVPHEVAERVLNHAITKVERTYNRHAYYEEKAAALQDWSDWLMQIVQGHPGVVVAAQHSRMFTSAGYGRS